MRIVQVFVVQVVQVFVVKVVQVVQVFGVQVVHVFGCHASVFATIFDVLCVRDRKSCNA